MLIFSRYTWWVGAMVGLALALAAAGATGVLNPVQGTFISVTSPLENVLTAVADPVASLLSGAGDIDNLQAENRDLRVENESLRNQITQLQQDVAEIDQLRQALKITESEGTAQRLAASIVHRDTSPFADVVSINRGSRDGVKKGMVVLSAQGSLIGTVTKTFDDSAFVRLITDGTSRVAAHVQGAQAADGIVSGGPNRKLTFELVQADIKVGDTVVSSGLGGSYPPDIPIGKVSSVSGTNQDIYRDVAIEPLVRMSTVQTVLVLTSFLPQRIDLDDE